MPGLDWKGLDLDWKGWVVSLGSGILFHLFGGRCLVTKVGREAEAVNRNMGIVCRLGRFVLLGEAAPRTSFFPAGVR